MIKEFKGDFRWLSNFAPCKIELDGLIYPSVEHAYMSAKNNNTYWKEFCMTEKSAGFVKKESYKLILTLDWDNKKIEVMKHSLIQKFNQEPYKSKLLNTENEFIQEGNMWNDKFWGVCLKTGKGENNLGRMIMDIRTKLRGCE